PIFSVIVNFDSQFDAQLLQVLYNLRVKSCRWRLCYRTCLRL
ncbi:hypothetical protein X975_15292, partial [Stegodyphus mimosarum]